MLSWLWKRLALAKTSSKLRQAKQEGQLHRHPQQRRTLATQLWGKQLYASPYLACQRFCQLPTSNCQPWVSSTSTAMQEGLAIASTQC